MARERRERALKSYFKKIYINMIFNKGDIRSGNAFVARKERHGAELGLNVKIDDKLRSREDQELLKYKNKKTVKYKTLDLIKMFENVKIKGRKKGG